ncbi:MAG: carboxyl transferase [Lachnospira sp.]|nr:carboxyl transferase [Lachnospira sp.]
MSNSTNVSARIRIDSLLDDSSFVEVGGYVTSRSTDFNVSNQENPADGVITGYGVIDGNLVYVYSQDASVLGGAIGEMHAKKIAGIYDMAMKMGAPVIGLIDCAGLRLQEATDALNGFGELFYKQTMASGVIPQITGIFGNCGGGTALIPALSDFTYMTKDAKLFVNSPNALEGNYEGKCDTASATYQCENTGNVDAVFETENELLGQIRQLIGILPANNEMEAYDTECSDDLNRLVANMEGYKDDARSALISMSDNNFFLESKKDYATGIVTGFIKLNGATVGCVANQTSESKGEICVGCVTKAAEFISFCDAFEIPVLTLTNVNSFKACECNEKKIAKAASKLIYTYSDATVPKVTVLIGDAFGTPALVMGAKSTGADIVYAWPNAKFSTMDAKAAVKIMYADELSKADDQNAFINEKAAVFTENQSSAMAAAKRGYIDDIIEPDATRKRVIAAFEMLYTKREARPAKKHGTV